MKRKTFLGFYNLSLLFGLEQLTQKLFGSNHIVSFNLKSVTLWILFKLKIKTSTNESS